MRLECTHCNLQEDWLLRISNKNPIIPNLCKFYAGEGGWGLGEVCSHDIAYPQWHLSMGKSHYKTPVHW